MKTAVVTGVLGQDGAYLSRLLLEKEYKVIGTFRPGTANTNWRLKRLGIDSAIEMMPLELLEFSSIQRVIEQTRPDELYNLAAQSFVGVSFDQPLYTTDADAMAVTRLLEVIRTVSPDTRFYQASTSEMYGNNQAQAQSETSPFRPRSPYAVSKLYGHWITVNYREAYGLYTASGILFNHESPLRGRDFVTRKITAAFAEMACGSEGKLKLGNLDVERDWGFADEYVRGIWSMLQRESGDDFVLATGKKASVRRFVELAGEAAGFTVQWSGTGVETVGRDARSGRVLVRIDPAFFRPTDVEGQIGDATKAHEELGWRHEVDLAALVEMMVQADIDALSRGEKLL